MGRTLRYLRIAVTVLSLTACVLLVALWVRSYRWSDMVGGYLSEAVIIRFHSAAGRLTVDQYPVENPGRWKWERQPAKEFARQMDAILQMEAILSGTVPHRPDFYFTRTNNNNGLILRAPYWFLVSSFGILAAISLPWIGWRFSLRTLLIATTLLAVVLGIIVAAR